ncbi:MAG: hypothetical protein V1899_11970 [Planctomycetota bacterium]
MAKRKTEKKNGQFKKTDETESAPDVETTSDTEKGGAAKASDFFGSLRDGFKTAGETAERYARMGINIATLEGLRLKLKTAYASLGESVMRCWDAASDIGVAANDPAIKSQVKTVNDLRRRIREIEIKLRNLKQS